MEDAFARSIPEVTPLSWTDWTVVLYLSLPVVIIDEVLKFVSRSPIGLRFRL